MLSLIPMLLNTDVSLYNILGLNNQKSATFSLFSFCAYAQCLEFNHKNTKHNHAFVGKKDGKWKCWHKLYYIAENAKMWNELPEKDQMYFSAEKPESLNVKKAELYQSMPRAEILGKP